MLDWISFGGNESPSGYTPIVSDAPNIARVPSTIGAGVAGPSSIALYDATNSTKDRRYNIKANEVRSFIMNAQRLV